MKLIYQGVLLDHGDVEALRAMPGGQQEIAVARAEMVAGYVMEQLYQYLHRYLAEFDFRYNNRCGRPERKNRLARNGLDDVQRAEALLRSVVGKRLLYRESQVGKH